MQNETSKENQGGSVPFWVPNKLIFYQRFVAWAILLVIGCLWGSSFVLAKLATQTGAHPIGVSFWQSIIGAFLLITFCAAFRYRISVKPKHLLFYSVCAVLGSVFPNTLYFYSAPHVSAGVLSISIATVPIMTYFASTILGLEKVKFRRFTGVVIGMCAVLLIVLPENALAHSGSVFWVLLTIIAAACYATENMIIAKLMPSGENAITVLTGMFVLATCFLIPLVISTKSYVSITTPWDIVEWAIVAMAVVNVVAYGFLIHLITIAGPVFASQMGYINTLSGVFWGIVVFSEQHSHWVWLALISMMAGLYLVKPKARKEIDDAG